jgi:hypothetical protein
LNDTKPVQAGDHANDQGDSLEDETKYTSSMPSKYKELAIRLHQMDRLQEEDSRRLKAAITICRC